MHYSLSVKAVSKLPVDQLLISLFAIVAILINLLPLNIPTAFKSSWNDVSWTLFSLATALKSFQTAHTCTGNRKRAWHYIASGCLIWFLGMLVWDYHHLLQNTYPPYPSLADVGYLIMAPLITMGIIHFRQEALTTSAMLYQITRIGVVFFTLLIIHFVIYSPLIEKQAISNLYIVISLSYPLLFFTSFIHAFSDTWYRYDKKSQQSVLLIVIGILIHALSNAEYAYSLLALDYYTSGYVDVAWTVGFVPIYFAAILQQKSSGNGKEKPHTLFIKLSEYINKSYLPLLLLALSISLLLNRDHINPELNDGFTLLISIFTVILVGYIWTSEQKERSFDNQLYAKDLIHNSLIEAIPYGIQECDLNGNIIYCNEAMYDILAAPPGSLIRRKIWDCAVNKEQKNRWRASFKKILDERPKPGNFIGPSLRDDGSLVLLKTDWNYRYNTKGELNGIVAVVTDITEQKQNENKLRQAATVFSSTTDAVIIADSDCNIIAVNEAFINISQYTEADVISKNPRILQSDRHPDEFYKNIWNSIQTRGHWNGEIWNLKKNGETYPTWTRVSTVTDDKNIITNYVLIFSDITKIKQSEEHLKFLAHHDDLTQLPNRTSLDFKLEQSIHRANRQQQKFAIFFIDLDQFKHINDSLGHVIGDNILIKASQRLTSIARNEDTVSRLGGDEFVLIIEPIDTIHHSMSVAERIIQIFSTAFEIEDLQLHVTPSIGIALYPDNGDNPEELLKNADAAMYRAKQNGRNNYAYYSEELTEKATQRIKYENMLRKALELNQLSLHYQPQIDIKQKKIHGIEALLRWQHPDEGMIPPSVFIPIAEESGLICTIGQWVLKQSCQLMKKLISEGIDIDHISVNVSGIQFIRGQFVDYVSELLKTHELKGPQLELEITESVIMNDKIKSIESLTLLGKLGISLSIDDFGTGYSSLSYLKKLPVNCIKIDRSFIHDIPEDKDDESIVKSIIALGQSLNLKVIAEGVEQESQVVFLQNEGCNLVQGFLFSKPVTENELLKLLKQPQELLSPAKSYS